MLSTLLKYKNSLWNGQRTPGSPSRTILSSVIPHIKLRIRVSHIDLLVGFKIQKMTVNSKLTPDVVSLSKIDPLRRELEQGVYSVSPNRSSLRNY
jgi:hypothetical protein